MRAWAGVEIPNPTAIGSGVAARTRAIVPGQIGGQRAAGAGDAEPGHEIDESARARHSLREPRRPGGGRDQSDQGEPAGLDRALDGGVAAGRQVGEEQRRPRPAARRPRRKRSSP